MTQSEKERMTNMTMSVRETRLLPKASVKINTQTLNKVNALFPTT